MLRQNGETICMFVPPADGGMALYARELLTAMAENPSGGRRFELVSSEDLAPDFKSELYPVHPILPAIRHRDTFANRAAWVAGRLTHYPKREWGFLKWLRGRTDVDGVHFQEWTPWLAAPLFRRIRKQGKKVYYTVHNVFPHKYPVGIPKSIYDGWTRRGCRLCNCLFVHTEALAGELSRFLGAGHPPIRVVPHGVWTVRNLAAGPTLDDRLAWKRLLFFGAIRRNKGLHLLLDALWELPGYSITIAGEPAEQDYFRSEILPKIARLREAGVTIDLHDRYLPESEIGPLFARHSAVVLPYTKEFAAQSGVVFMALAHELPVVASEAGGLGDVFEQFKIGTTFRGGAPADLAIAIRGLTAGDGRAELLEQIRAAKRRFSWQTAAAATLAGYALARQEGRRQADDRAVAASPAH